VSVVTFQAAVLDLVEHLQELADELGALATIASEDAPSGSSFVDRLRESVTTACGLVEEGLDAADRARVAVAYRPDVPRARRDATAAHGALAKLERVLVSDVGSTRHRAELNRMRRGREGAWAAWAAVVGDTIDRCIQQLHEVNDALVRAAEELLEPDVVSVAVSVHTVDPIGDAGASGRRIRTAERSEDVR
jgi:hypothetical protein